MRERERERARTIWKALNNIVVVVLHVCVPQSEGMYHETLSSQKNGETREKLKQANGTLHLNTGYVLFVCPSDCFSILSKALITNENPRECVYVWV